MPKYIIANWKSNKNLAEVRDWTQQVKQAGLPFSSEKVVAVLCSSFVHLPLLAELLPELTLGAQTLSAYPNGAYTGAISAQIAREYVKFAILGHAERRKYFHENDQMVTQQTLQALENEITPIVAVDSFNWGTLLSQLSEEQLQKVLVMYEPPEAISSSAGGHAADLDDVKQSVQLIKSKYQVKGVLYGGSVNTQNILRYITQPEIDGVVPGAASLKVEEFTGMLKLTLEN